MDAGDPTIAAVERVWTDVVACATEHAAHLRAVDTEERTCWATVGEGLVPALTPDALAGAARLVGSDVVAPYAVIAERDRYLVELHATLQQLRSELLDDHELVDAQTRRRDLERRLGELRVVVKQQRAEPGFLERWEQVRAGKRKPDAPHQAHDAARQELDEAESEARRLAAVCAQHFRVRNRVEEVVEQEARADQEFLREARRSVVDALLPLGDDDLCARAIGSAQLLVWLRRIVAVRAKRALTIELFDLHVREPGEALGRLHGALRTTEDAYGRAMLPQRAAVLGPRVALGLQRYRSMAAAVVAFDDYAAVPERASFRDVLVRAAPAPAVVPLDREVAALAAPSPIEGLFAGELTLDDSPLPESQEEAEIFTRKPSGVYSRPKTSHDVVSTVRGGTRLGRYVVKGLLGKGGMGEVYIASQEGAEGFEKEVVLKRMASDMRDNAQFVSMFIREARIAATLSHPNIVQIFDLQRDGDELFIVMERLDGLSLQKLRRRDPSLPVLLRMFSDAARGLAVMHGQTDDHGRSLGLLHRDISPDNLFATTAGFTKILDFGVARRDDLTVITARDELKGKIPFMAPEQIRGDPIDGRVDLFSLGATFFWLFTGQRPFGGPTEVATLHAVLHAPPPDLGELRRDLPRPVVELVLSLLQKRREDRPADARRVLAALEPLGLASHDDVATFIAASLETAG